MSGRPLARPRRGTAAALLALAALAACRGGNDDRADAGFRPLDVGAPVPAYAARTTKGDTVRVGASEPVTLLNVWATWCTSCRDEMADLDSLQREFGARGLRVVGVSVDQGDGTRVRRFAQGEHLSFTVAHDPAGEVQQRYQVFGVPTTFLIARDGRLLWRHTGNVHSKLNAVRAAVEAELGRSGGAAHRGGT